MWLAMAAVFLVGGLVLRRQRDRLSWTTPQRAALALVPLSVVLLCALVMVAVPFAMQQTDSSSVTLSGTPTQHLGTPRPIPFFDAVGSMASLILGVPIALSLFPVMFGLRPWPRGAFTLAAVALTVLSVLTGFSVGLVFFPAAMAAWMPVVGGPRS